MPSHNTCYFHTGFVHKSPIVSIHFLNEWGDQKVVPYKPQISSRERTLKAWELCIYFCTSTLTLSLSCSHSRMFSKIFWVSQTTLCHYCWWETNTSELLHDGSLFFTLFSSSGSSYSAAHSFLIEILIVVFPLQSFSFPGFIPAGKVTPPIQNNAILMSEYFTCHG